MHFDIVPPFRANIFFHFHTNKRLKKILLYTVTGKPSSLLYTIASAAEELKEGLPSSQPSTAKSLGTREFT